MKLFLSLIQIIHIWNTLVGVILFGLLVGVSSKIKTFVINGGEAAGYGNFQTFAYPATIVYMFIPTIAATIYSTILSLDSSPKYKAWLPSKTMQTSVFFVAFITFLAAVLPEIPGADIMVNGSALECTWTDYMQWKIVFNNPIVYPWVTAMDEACAMFKASVAFCYILFLGWLLQAFNYLRSTQVFKKTN
ncbi:hypothetical protein BY458DRAFT_523137 [Sporodiniella umbellata]|nr:hypothetical protein BY458DRAFT_523137 [Sporodiniella umbellata]